MSRFAQLGNDLYTGDRSFDFTGRRKLWYAISLIVMALSLFTLFTKGLTTGVEFRGGTEYRVTGAQTMSEEVGVNAVHSVLPQTEVRVSKVGNNSIRIQTDEKSEDKLEPTRKALAKAYGVDAGKVSRNFVGPTWGSDVTRQAVTGLLVFLVLVSITMALYFRTWKMALAALIALIHDLIATAGIYSFIGFEVTPAAVIGFLTILGYSLYDTVVVFDKVRENTQFIFDQTKSTFDEAANLAINQTVVRSINTTVVALLPIGAVLFIGAYILGAGTLKDVSLALFVGTALGAYSSVFIATPLYVHLRDLEPQVRDLSARVLKRREQMPPAVQENEPHQDFAHATIGQDATQEYVNQVARTQARQQPRRQPAKKRPRKR